MADGGLRVYVAGSSREIVRVRRVHTWLREHGHTVTHDWTREVEAAIASGVSEEAMGDIDALTHVWRDLDAVRAADVLWLLSPQEPTRGAWVELGFATGIGKPIVVTGPGCRQSIFTRLGVIYHEDAAGLAVIDRMACGDLRAVAR